MINKKARITEENVLFLILNLVFFSILFLFVMNSVGGTSVQQEKLAKEIVLFLDSAKPGTLITLNLQDLAVKYEKASAKEIVYINDINKVLSVSLTNKGSYNYKYFNNAKFVILENSQKYILQIEVKDEN